MKRILGVLLALVLLCTACPVSAESANAMDALLEQLSACLVVSDQAYSICMETNQQILDFCEQRNYSTLVYARLASDQAQRQLKALSLPVLTISDQALFELMLMDVETDSLEAELHRIALSVPNMPETMYLYEVMLYSTLLNSSEVDILSQHVTMNQRCAELIMEYQCALVNYLLLPVADQPQVAAFWADIPARYPTLGRYQVSWETESDALNDHFIRIEEEYSAQTSLSSEVLGRYAYAYEQYNRSVQQDDTETLNSRALVIDGMPLMVPLPDDWIDLKTSEFRAGKETAGALPNVVMLIDENVTLDAFNRYVDELLYLGAELYEQEGNTEEGLTYTLLITGNLLMLDWLPDNTAMVGYKPERLSLELLDYILCQ